VSSPGRGGNGVPTTGLATAAGAVTARILCELWQTKRTLLFWALFPVLMLLLFGSIYAQGSRPQASFDATAPGILVGAALFFSCLSGPVSVVVAERERRTIRRVLLSPIPAIAYPLGVVGAFLVVAAAQTVLVYGTAFLFGGRYRGDLGTGVLILFLSVACYTLMGFVLGARLARRVEDVNGPVAAIGVPLLVLAGTFFPASILPPFLKALNLANPIYHMNEALRPVSAKGVSLVDVGSHVALLGFLAALLLVATALAFRRLQAEEREA
jgi:ABC-2 type transport system permease protein